MKIQKQEVIQINPKIHCQKNGMETLFFIGKANEVAPLFDSIAFHYCSDPDYGVQLRESVAKHIRGENPDRRKNPNRIQFRCTDDMKQRIIRAMDICSCATIQEIMMLATKMFLYEIEKTAAASGTGDSGAGRSPYVNTDNISQQGGVVK